MPIEDPCIFCGSAGERDVRSGRFLALPDDGPYAVYRCRPCAYGWLSPAVSADNQEKLYDRSYFDPAVAGCAYQLQVKELLVCFERQAARFKASAPNPRILDVGCATGEFMDLARKIGLEVTGLDISAYACQVCRSNGFPVIQGDIFSLQLLPQSFGGLHVSHVLEHFAQPVAAVRRLHKLLAPGGVLYLEVPYQFDGWLDRLNTRRNRLSKYPQWSLHHRSFFSPRSLGRLLQQSGFDILHQTTFLACHRQLRPAGLRKWGLQIFLWLADKLARKGDLISVWAKKGAPDV